jgi:hypothetical protein
MKFLTKINILSVLGIIFTAGLLFSVYFLGGNKEVNALSCANHTLLGYAWSENTGWVSFSCKNNPLATEDYGVNINSSTGLMSGYAWSENIGWISFEPADLAGCPEGGCAATLSTTTNYIFGWARALAASSSASGWDGWIKFNGTTTDGTPYRLVLNGATKELEGWAWGGNGTNASTTGTIGWISFNCSNTASCATVNYKVRSSIQPPTVANLIAPADDSANYCGTAASFEWIYQDPDSISSASYQFRVNTVNDVNDLNPAVDISSTGRSDPSGSTIIQPIVVSPFPIADELAYDVGTYYWWVKSCNQGGACSGWVQGPNFSTPEKPYPDAVAAWGQKTISVGDTVQFCSTADIASSSDPCYSICWTTSTMPIEVSPNNPNWACSVCFDSASSTYKACQEVGASYFWKLDMDEGVDYEFASSSDTSPNPRIKFLRSSDDKGVALEVTMGSSSCIGTKSLETNMPIPKWKEVSPY